MIEINNSMTSPVWSIQYDSEVFVQNDIIETSLKLFFMHGKFVDAPFMKT